jgi:PAS domain-containing protein
MRNRDADPPPSGKPDETLPSRSTELLEIVPCALMEVAIDAGGHRAITFFSGPASQMYGYSRTDALGRDPVFLSAAAPDEISRRRAAFDETGRCQLTTKHLTKGGRMIDVELDGLAWRDERLLCRGSWPKNPLYGGISSTTPVERSPSAGAPPATHSSPAVVDVPPRPLNAENVPA